MPGYHEGERVRVGAEDFVEDRAEVDDYAFEGGLMFINITMLVRDRPRHTEQTIKSLYQTSASALFDLVVLDDQSQSETFEVLNDLQSRYGFRLHRNEVSEGTGSARNQVIDLARRDQGELLMLTDNDVCYLPGWLERLVKAYQGAKELGLVALGAYAHPYMQPNEIRLLKDGGRVAILDALPLQSWLWSWEDAERFLPFDQTPPGRVRMSEDWAVSQRIKAAGGSVGVLVPSAIVSTGVTDSFGELIPGHDVVVREPRTEGVWVG